MFLDHDRPHRSEHLQQYFFAIARRSSGVNAGEGRALHVHRHPIPALELVRWRFGGQFYQTRLVGAGAQSLDLSIRDPRRRFPKLDKAEHAKGSLYRPPAVDDPHKNISQKERLNRSSSFDPGEKDLEASRLEVAGGEGLALRLRATGGEI